MAARSLPPKPKTATAEDELLANGLVRYHLEPPSWRAPWLSGKTASGYPQFFPTCEGQAEDQLTESNVKSGFTGKAIVQTESFSAHQLIYGQLKAETFLPSLSRLAMAVVERAQGRIPSYGPSTFRLPSRVTVNEQKRETWFNDLANEGIPLSRLSRNVPHGYVGEKKLEMLFARKVPIIRAVWFVRAIGAIEIQASRSRPGFSITNYTREWTIIVQEFVRKQLGEISLANGPPQPPSAPEPRLSSSMSSASAFRPPSAKLLVDSELRQAWTARLSYTLKLLEALYEEHLIDRESFLRFIIQQLENSNLGQLPFVLFLAEEYTAEFLLSEPLAAHLASACLSRLKTLPSGPANPAIAETANSLTSLIRSFFISLPDAFVASPLWSNHHKELETIILVPELEYALAQTIRSDMADLAARSEASNEGTQDAESILDDIAFPADIGSVHKALFHKRRRRIPLTSELHILFTWAVSPDRAGIHRSYAVATLIGLEREYLITSSGSTSAGRTKMDVEAAFILWVDKGAASWSKVLVASLLSELIRVGVVSYSLYLQRMIARGETELRNQLLRSVALFGDVGNRKVSLRSEPSSRLNSDRLLDTVQHQLELLIPNLINDSGVMMDLGVERNCEALKTSLTSLAVDGSHLTITRQLIPSRLQRLSKSSSSSYSNGTQPSSLTVDDHAIFVFVFETVKDYWGLSNYLIAVLQTLPPRELLLYVLDVVEAHLDLWTAMGQLGHLAIAIYSAHESLKNSGVNDRRLVSLLRQLGVAGHLSTAALTQMELEFQGWTLSLSTTRSQAQSMPTGLPELQSLLIDNSPAATAQLATTLWYRYNSFDNWGQVVLEGALHLLPHVLPNVISAFLREIHERLPQGIEPHLARWMTHMSPHSASATFGGPSGASLVAVCAELVSEGTLRSATVVTHLLPVWRTLLVDATAPPVLPTAVVVPTVDKTLQLRAVETLTTIFSNLVGVDVSSSTDVSPTSTTLTPSALLQQQRAHSRRSSLFTTSSLPNIGRCIALLAIQQELWVARGSSDKATTTGHLILTVSSGDLFKMAVARDPQALASSMLESQFISTIPSAPANRPKILAALLLALKDGSTTPPTTLVSTEDWDLFLSGLSIWHLAVSKVEVQSWLERLELDTSLQEAEKAEALHSLSRHFLDRVCSGAGHTYLGEQVVRCYHGKASDELISVAFARLSEAVDGLSESASPERRAKCLTTLRCTGRLLNTLLASNKASSRIEPLNQLLCAIKGCLEGLVDSDRPPLKDAVLYSTHLLGVALRCSPPTPPAETCDLFKDCLIPCAKLAAVLSQDRSDETELATLLLDTSAHLLFSLISMAPSLRIPSFQSFLAQDIDIDSLSNTTTQRLLRLFGFYSTTVPLLNAWEMVDHMDPGPNKELRHNVGPIDLALFDAKVIEAIPAVTALDCVPQSPATSSGHSERGIQTNFDSETPCTGLSVAARDHRRTLGGTRSLIQRYDPMAKRRPPPAIPTPAPQEIVISESPPPATSAASATGPSATASATSSTKKRKEAPEVVVLSDDDEPLATRAPPAKRGRGSTASKSTTRKKTK
ncbi:hypothetical protein T439DRAFT_381275 [Meredithblackwellia eburnea MCA 4105]